MISLLSVTKALSGNKQYSIPYIILIFNQTLHIRESIQFSVNAPNQLQTLQTCTNTSYVPYFLHCSKKQQDRKYPKVFTFGYNLYLQIILKQATRHFRVRFLHYCVFSLIHFSLFSIFNEAQKSYFKLEDQGQDYCV